MINLREKIPILVLGIGNYLMGDEGVAIHVIERLQQDSLSPLVQLLDGGVGSFTLLESMQSCKHLIIIDAANDGKKPGTISKIFPEFSSDYPRTLTAHDIGLKDLIETFYLSGNELPEVVLFTISIRSLPDHLSVELSEEVKSSIPKVCEEIKKEIENRLNYFV